MVACFMRAQEQFQRTPQDRRMPPVVDLDASPSDGGESDMNSDLGFSWRLVIDWQSVDTVKMLLWIVWRNDFFLCKCCKRQFSDRIRVVWRMGFGFSDGFCDCWRRFWGLQVSFTWSVKPLTEIYRCISCKFLCCKPCVKKDPASFRLRHSNDRFVTFVMY